MTEMTRVIAVASGKGGVGRTTLTFNLGMALAMFERKVVMLDLDLAMANLDIVTGILNPDATLHDVLAKNKSLIECIYEIDSGVYVIPTGISLEMLKHINTKRIGKIMQEVVKYGDICIVDMPPGIDAKVFSGLPEDVEMIILTSSTMSSVADALKIRVLLEQLNIRILGFVLNMWHDDEFLLSVDEIVSILDIPMLSLIPYDREIERSIALGKAIVEINPSSPTSDAIMQLAADLVGEHYRSIEPDKEGIMARLVKLIKK